MLGKNSLISLLNPKSPISEAYRMLRTNIQFTSPDRQIKTIMLTSSMPGEGKTTIITNLAVVIAQAGSRVLLVDTDLRKPNIHNFFNVNYKSGIAKLLTKNDTFESCVQPSGVERLDIMPCGLVPPNPSELIGSNSMRNFIEYAKDRYDMVLFDSPPVTAVTDAAVLSTLCDGVIFVCNSGKITVDAAKRAKELLYNVNANILGAVLNRVDKNSKSYYIYEYNQEVGSANSI